jgi:hypothetical protein
MNAFFCGGGDWVVKTNALNETAIATGAFVCHHNIEKRASFSTATGESNDDHDVSFGEVE